MRDMTVIRPLVLAAALASFGGCGGSSSPDPTPHPALAPLSGANVNLVFVTSPDLAYQAPGDVDPTTANLTPRGLNRSLLMATFLHEQVLGGENVSGIYVLEPMTHLQTAQDLPDLAPLEGIQQFAMLNQIALSSDLGRMPEVTANSYPLNVSYGFGGPPPGVAEPLFFCLGCQGLDFEDRGNANEELAAEIVEQKVPGFYVFSAPWETIASLLAKLDQYEGYDLTLPAAYPGPNAVHAISITPSGTASFTTFDSKSDPSAAYPVLPAPSVVRSPCSAPGFSVTVTGGTAGAVVPEGINTNETVYLVRHAEAHPVEPWEDGNYVAAGQWRALDLPNALAGKISPDVVYSIDPAQVVPSGRSSWSYVRTVLTVQPYAIANNLPYRLVSTLELMAPDSPQQTSDYFFTGGRFSNQTVLLAWEHDHIPPTVNALLASYGSSQTAAGWAGSDYDSVWTVKLDASGNLTVDNSICEGIDSASLPVAAPRF